MAEIRRAVAFAAPLKGSEEDNEDPRENSVTAYQAHLAKLSSPPPRASEPNENHQPSNPAALNHLQYKWPGQTGRGIQHLDVRPMLFNDILSKNRIVIPLFQRRYIWTEKQIRQWFRDVAMPGGVHRTHKTMFKRDTNGTLICVDGQQRLTTATLLLAALRKHCRRTGLTATVRSIDALLFNKALAPVKRWAEEEAKHLVQEAQSQADQYQWKMRPFPSGWLPEEFETTLVPSFVDRASYFEIICHDHVLEALEKQHASSYLGFSSECQSSVQHKTFRIFSQEISRLVGNGAKNKLQSLFRKQTDGFSLMYIELLTNDNIQQVFLWMQEKTVFGMGRLLFNPHPGVDFKPIDLTRNLVVSSVMNRPLEEQMEFYQKCWVTPLEDRFGTDQLERILEHLVERVTTEKPKEERYVGNMEKQLEMQLAMAPVAMQESLFPEDMPMMVYAKFHSWVQKRANDLEGDANAITIAVADSVVRDLVREGESMDHMDIL